LGGRFAAQWELPLAVVENGAIMAGNRFGRWRTAIYDKYKTEYDAVFSGHARHHRPCALPGGRQAQAGRRPPANPNPPDGAWEGMAPADKTVITGSWPTTAKH